MKEVFKKSLSSSWMIVKLVIPFAIGIDVLNYLGVIDNVSFLFQPVTDLLKLQPGIALVLAAGFFFNLYAGIAVAASLGLNAYEWTIVGTFLAICHSIPLEAAILKKVGFPIMTHTLSRLVAALFGAWLVSYIASPELLSITNTSVDNVVNYNFIEMLWLSIINSLLLTMKIIFLVTSLIVGFELFRKWRPIANFLGIHTYMSSLLVGGLLGVTYGAGILLKDIENVSTQHKLYLLTFLMLAHGLIEETLLFGFFKADLFLIFSIRVGIAIVALLGVYFFSSFQKSKSVKYSNITNQ
jgi:hypothetical protein